MGTSAGGAAPGLPRPEPVANSIDAALGRIGIPRFILDLRPARDNAEVFAWLSTQRPMQANIDTHFVITPSTAFDALLFIDQLTPAHPLTP